MYRVMLMFAAVLLLVGVTACSGGDQSIKVSTEWEIVMEGLAFNRGTVAVPPGEEVVLHLKNNDTYTHYFALYMQEDAQKPFAGPIEVPAHTRKEFSFTSPAATGRYYYRDAMYSNKMKGILIVSDRDEVTPD